MSRFSWLFPEENPEAPESATSELDWAPADRLRDEARRVHVFKGDRCGAGGSDSVVKINDGIAIFSGVGRERAWFESATAQRAIWQFALLPESEPRLVLPIATADALRLGLGLHRPGRRGARAAVFFVRLLARFGIGRRLLRRRLTIAYGSSAGAPRGLLLSGLEARHIRDGKVALYLGTSGADRKTVVLPLGEGKPGFIVKLGETAEAVAALRREAAALGRMADSALCACVPRLLKRHGAAAGTLALHLEYRERRWCRAGRLRSEAQAFLRSLSSLDRGEVPLQQWLATHALEGATGCIAWSRLRAALAARAADGVRLVTHRVHGDFAPWNCAMTRQGFFVYDWEASRPDGLALGDAFHFVLAPALLVRRLGKPRREFARALAMALPLGKSVGLVSAAVDLHMAAWLLTWYPQRAEPGLVALREMAAERLA